MFHAILGIIIIIFTPPSMAKISYSLSNQEKFADESRAHINHFLKDTENLLPTNLFTEEDLHIKIEFAPLKGSTQEILAPGNSGAIVGYVTPFSLSPKIILNKNLLEILLNAQLGSQKSLRHHNGHRLATATLLHETAHVIDFYSKRSPHLQREILECSTVNTKNHSAIPKTKYFKNCNQALRSKGRLSGNPDFLRRLRWDNVKLSEAHPGSPNQYEYTNQEEFFAVNFEYFLLDPQFSCRRPTIYQQYQEVFQWNPFPQPNCKSYSHFFVMNSPQTVDLDLQKIIRISYLHASEGEAIMSRWGHSMFKIDYCDQSIINGICPGKIKNIIAGFQAHIVDSQIDNLKGIFGKYPSRLFFLDTSKILSEYTRKELRDVEEYELNLSQEQIKLFTLKLYETYWSYSSKYKFFSNNCAIEASNFIQSVLHSGHPFNNEDVQTPIELLKALKKTLLISQIPIKHYASFTETLNLALGILGYTGQQVLPMQWKEYSELTKSQRHQLYKNKTSPTEKEAAAFQVVERYQAYLDSLKEMNEKIRLAQDLKSQEDLKNKTPEYIRQSSGYSYGIPTADETLTYQEYSEIWRQAAKEYREALAQIKIEPAKD